MSLVPWSGSGLLVALIAAGALVGGTLADKALTGTLQGFGMPAFAIGAAGLTFALSRRLARDDSRATVDSTTGEQARRDDSLLLIPVHVWVHIFLGMGIAISLSQLFAPR